MSDDNIYIQGFGIKGYRSFGTTHQRIGPFSKVNLFLGQNNAGKSNVLRFLQDHFFKIATAAQKLESYKFDDLEVHKRLDTSSEQFEVSFSRKFDDAFLENTFSEQLKSYPDLTEYIKAFLKCDILTLDEISWFIYKKNSQNQFVLSSDLISSLSEKMSPFTSSRGIQLEFQQVERGLTGNSNHGLESSIQLFLERLSPLIDMVNPVEVALIPAFRSVGEPTDESFEYSGAGLIKKLVQLERPERGDSPKKFQDIMQFIREVTANNSAKLRIPASQKEILVEIDGRELPIEALGTGIHEVIILATNATLLENQVVCLEEPELHLHPVLQKKLIRYLKDKTSNQYFISTHSAHLLDTPEASIFHVWLENGETRVNLVKTDKERHLICTDLGYKASDILQSNCIIWVEGPSDRIYLNHWIKAVDSDLIEGVDYSIMFYGGRLLSNLSADDPDVIKDFISLRRLNRHISIIIDSDRASEGEVLNETKRRIEEEFNQGPGFAWITEGREAENYIDVNLLEDAAKKVHPRKVKELVNRGQYDNCLNVYRNPKEEVKDISEKASKLDKVKIAQEIIEKHPANLDILDLRKQIECIVKFIRQSNG